MAYTYRPKRNIFTYAQCTTPEGAQHLETWYNYCTGRAYKMDASGTWQTWELVTDPERWSGVAGYVTGGLNGGSAIQSGINKLWYADETITKLGATLSQTKASCAGFNSSAAGYVAEAVCGGAGLLFAACCTDPGFSTSNSR